MILHTSSEFSLSTHGGSTDIRQVASTYFVESRGNKVKSRELYYLCLLISWYLILQFHLIWKRVMIYSYQVQRHVTTEDNKARKACALDMHLQLERMWRQKKYLSKEHRELEYRIWLIDEGVFVQYTGYWIGWSILHICHSFLLESWLLSFLAINTKLSNSKLRECIFLLRISANLIIVIFKEIFLVDFKHYPKHYVKMA